MSRASAPLSKLKNAINRICQRRGNLVCEGPLKTNTGHAFIVLNRHVCLVIEIRNDNDGVLFVLVRRDQKPVSRAFLIQSRILKAKIYDGSLIGAALTGPEQVIGLLRQYNYDVIELLHFSLKNVMEYLLNIHPRLLYDPLYSEWGLTILMGA